VVPLFHDAECNATFDKNMPAIIHQHAPDGPELRHATACFVASVSCACSQVPHSKDSKQFLTTSFAVCVGSTCQRFRNIRKRPTDRLFSLLLPPSPNKSVGFACTQQVFSTSTPAFVPVSASFSAPVSAPMSAPVSAPLHPDHRSPDSVPGHGLDFFI
jgi:hypothetical protein